VINYYNYEVSDMSDTIERTKQKMYSTGEIAKLCGITVRTVQYSRL